MMTIPHTRLAQPADAAELAPIAVAGPVGMRWMASAMPVRGLGSGSWFTDFSQNTGSLVLLDRCVQDVG